MEARTRQGEGFAWARWFVVIGAILGTALVFVTPALGGTDEVAHMSRVALIAEGHVIPPTSAKPSSNYQAGACITAYVKGYQLERYLGTRSSWRDQFDNGQCDADDISLASPSRTADFYTPVPYAPALVGFWAGKMMHGPAGSVYGARLVQLGAYIAMMAFVLARAPWGRPLFFTIGLLPVCIGGAANVSADPMTLALACLTVAKVLRALGRARLGEPIPRREWWILAVTCGALALSKSAYVPFAALILTIPTIVFVTLRRRLAIAAGILGSTAVVAGAWNLGVAAHISVVGINQSNSVETARIIKSHPLGFLQSIPRGWQANGERSAILGGLFTPVRRFAHNFPMPILPGLIWLVAARFVEPIPRFLDRLGRDLWTSDTHCVTNAVVARTDDDGGPEDGAEAPFPPACAPVSSFDRLMTLAVTVTVALATILLIEYGLALAANPPGAGQIVWVQGRYFIPLIPLTLIGFHETGRSLRRSWSIVFPIVSSMLVLSWMWWASTNIWNWW